jgi:hypothetical protein
MRRTVVACSLLAACTTPTPATDAALVDAVVPDATDAWIAPDVGGLVPTWVGATHGTIKLRPASSLPGSRVVSIEAARNEWEPYQIAFSGGFDGRMITGVVPGVLTGPGGATIDAAHSFVHAERLITLPMPSNVEGDVGPWPDALVPVTDLLFGEARNAFPIMVPSFELRAVWVDVLVPNDAAPGDYTGLVHVTSSDGAFDVPVMLHVFDFALPSTPTLRNYFGGPDDTPCVAFHHGAWTGTDWGACADTDPGGDGDRLTEHYRQQFMQLALEYRMSLGGGVYIGPRDATALTHFDSVYGGLLDGTATRHLVGSHLTTLALQFNSMPPDTATTQLMVDHVTMRGWDALVFDYTADEPESQMTCPPTGTTCPTITDRAAIVSAGHARPLVTAQLRYAQPHGFASAVQILVPIINDTRAPDTSFPDYQPVSAYAPWLASNAQDLLWWYQSCESHGCGDPTACGSPTDTTRGFPSYVIDASAVQNRAMEWLTFLRGITGELYYATAYGLVNAWTNPCSFGGAGDGTMFYPGRVDVIGGTTDVPVASIRMALVREGLEDYEYLHLLASRGDTADAMSIASALFTEVNNVSVRTGDDVMTARHQLAMLIEAHR